MASLIERSRKNGTAREVQFTLGKLRKVVRLGAVSKTTAETAKRHIEQLVNQRDHGQRADRYTHQWLAEIGDVLHGRIASSGLVDPRVSVQLGPFIDRFIKDLGPEFKDATVTAWKMAKLTMVEHFGDERDIRTITEGDAKAYRAWLIGKKLAEATVRRRCGHAKRMLGYAVSLRIIDANPFGNKAVPTAAPKGGAKTFIDDELSRRILDNLPDARWRLIWSLGRWGGVRVPSEIAALRWDGVDWESSRLTIHSPKTERYDGRAARVIPLFPEIDTALLNWYEVGHDGGPLVLPHASTNGGAYRKTLIRAIEVSGGKPWAKLWTAARATRRTELKKPMSNGLTLPDEAVNAWMGHSTTVGDGHYGTGSHLVDQAFDAALGKRSELRSRQPKIAQVNANKNPRLRPSKAETGVGTWPTGTLGPTAIALLVRRLCEEGQGSAAQSAAQDSKDWNDAYKQLDVDHRVTLSAVARLLINQRKMTTK